MMTSVGCAHAQKQTKKEAPTVYFTKEITPQSLLQIYKALGVTPQGKVAVKISTGESEQTGYLRPDFIKPLIDETKGVIVECNTAYGGSRGTTADHLRAIAERGFTDIAEVDIMDADGDMRIPVSDTTHIKYDIVGSHLARYDFMINLAHFKGHAMGGFGGVLKTPLSEWLPHGANSTSTRQGRPTQAGVRPSRMPSSKAWPPPHRPSMTT